MSERYSHKERMQMILTGEEPDRFAASFWRHFFQAEHHAEGLAEAMVFFQEKFDWDFMKINPRADYHVEDFGLKQEFSHDEFKKHRKYDFPITKLEDWAKIQPLPLTSPVLSEHLKAVSLIRKKVDRELPLLMTVFTPLAIAGRMVEDDNLLAEHLHSYPEKVLPALRAITDTFKAFVIELRNAGADGIFFATTQWASSDLISWKDYQKFGLPFGLEVIRASGDDAINICHVCSSNNFLEQLLLVDYSASMYNWDSDDPTNLPLDKARELMDEKVALGGADRDGWLLQGKPDEVGYQIDKLKDNFEPSKLVIGPGCSIPPETPMENLQAVRDRL